MDDTDSDSVEFNNIQELERDGKGMEESSETSISKCSMFRMSMSQFKKERGFGDDGVYRLFCDNKDSENYYDFQISNLQKKDSYIAKIRAVKTGKARNKNEGQAKEPT